MKKGLGDLQEQIISSSSNLLSHSDPLSSPRLPLMLLSVYSRTWKENILLTPICRKPWTQWIVWAWPGGGGTADQSLKMEMYSCATKKKKRAVCSGHKSTRTQSTNKIQEQEHVSSPHHQCVAGYLHHTSTFIQGTPSLLKHTTYAFCSFPRNTGETSRMPPWACSIQLGSAIYNVSNVKKVRRSHPRKRRSGAPHCAGLLLAGISPTPRRVTPSETRFEVHFWNLMTGCIEARCER